jgi:predicted phosphoribosyltransferase
MRFRDRTEAGRVLGSMLQKYAERSDLLILGLPRGGVPVAYEVARALNAPMDLFVVRKLGVPGQEELAMGAIASGGIRVLNQDVISGLAISDAVIESVASMEMRELERRESAYRGGRDAPCLESRCLILIDDGLATGSSMRAAVRAVRTRNPSRTVIAVPVAAPETCSELRDEVDEIVCATTPARFAAVGLWYDDFSQTTDEEVKQLYEKIKSVPGTSSPF